MSHRAKKELTALGVRPSKSRGQNFLIAPAVAQRIVDAAALAPEDHVLEIGPGLGILSDLITARACRGVTLVELEATLAEEMRRRYADRPQVQIVNQDFLEVDLSGLLDDRIFKVIGNLPFNVAAAILHRLCAHHRSIARMVLMFQREVGQRIRATSGSRDYGALTLYTALYWKVEDYFRVEAGSFHPRPKVDAEVMIMTAQAEVERAVTNAQIEQVIRAAFSARRKTLRNALASGLKKSYPQIERVIRAARLDPQARAEQLELNDFIRLAAGVYEQAESH